MSNLSETQPTRALTAKEAAQVRELAAASSQEPISVLFYLRDGIRAVPLAQDRPLVVGRTAPADVALPDESLSRQHARLSISAGQVLVEDLGSTNGTWLDGQRVERGSVLAGSRLRFGRLAASLHRLALAAEGEDLGLLSHEQLLVELSAELARGRLYRRPCALLMLRPTEAQATVGPQIAVVRQALRPFDRLALYSPDTLELLLPEYGAPEALALAQRLLDAGGPLRVGVGAAPEHASTAEALLELTCGALCACPHTQAAPGAGEICLAAAPASQRPTLDAPLVHGQAMRAVLATVERLGPTTLPVLIVGETGTGKEVVARAIHQAGPRRARRLVTLNCGAIPAELVESTLFGHERGAFTGASQAAAGLFEAADGSTILLDEIGELPPAAQASLLRVLETKRFSRVGSTRELAVDVRVLAATHRDLEAMVRAGQFREDLLFRLDAMTVRLPPLRERPEEIEPLALLFMAQANSANARACARLAPAALAQLRAYRWPGNIRELRNVIERAVVIAHGDTIETADLPERVRAALGPTAPTAVDPPSARQAPPDEAPGPTDLRLAVQRFEAGCIERALQATSWDRAAAAAALNVPLRTLSHKIQQFGIRRPG